MVDQKNQRTEWLSQRVCIDRSAADKHVKCHQQRPVSDQVVPEPAGGEGGQVGQGKHFVQVEPCSPAHS